MRQPSGPDGSKGFNINRSSKSFEDGEEEEGEGAAEGSGEEKNEEEEEEEVVLVVEELTGMDEDEVFTEK